MRSTEHHAKAAVTSRIGRFATLRGFLQGRGSGAPARGVVAASLAALCVLLALCAGVARAEPPRLISYGAFSTHEEAGVGLAVDGSGDLLVSSLFEGLFAPSKIVKLDPSGKLLSPPSPFGSAHYSGVAVNPVNGDVYVLGEEGGFLTPATPAMIFVYAPDTGALLSSFEVSASRNFFFWTNVQIATDSVGNVYVPNALENEVLEYSPGGTLLKTLTGSGASALEGPTGVAVDSSGNLWVADSGSNKIVELDSSGASVEVNGKPVEIENEGVGSVALDGHGHVFALVDNSADPCGERESPCLHLIEYSSEGRRLADVGASRFGKVGGEAERFYSTVAVNEANGRVYVLAGQQETIWTFAPPTAPVVGQESVAEVGPTEAKLGALVNPGGAQTAYRFDYGPTSAYGSSAPVPEGSVGEGITARVVWASASGLAAGTTYHYHVVVTSELGTVYGPDQTFTTPTAEEVACPNEQMRGGFSERLPDCRAYELVTSPVKSSSQFDANEAFAYASRAAADGEALTLRSLEPRPGAPNAGEHYVATRGTAGWTAEDIMPLEAYDGVTCPEFQVVYGYSEQLTKTVMQVDGGARPASDISEESPESCNPEGRQVVSGEPVGYENLLVRDNATGAYQLVNVTPPGVTPADAHFQAASADLSHVIFTETAPLVKGARYGVENLYEWDEGALRLASVLPDGTVVPGSLAAKMQAVVGGINKEMAAATSLHNVISSDGSHVLFTYGGALYDRIDGQRTVQVDEKHGGSDPSGGGVFRAASAEGSHVFFLDESKLTPGSTAETGEPDLYECALPAGANECELTDLSDAKAGEHADVQSVLLGSRDSSRVYFAATGVLAANKHEYEYTDAAGNSHKVVEEAQRGRENLYLYQGGTITFIANEVGGESASPDGVWLAFDTNKSLTGYDNIVPSSGQPTGEIFLYNASGGQVVCASCNPSGEAPAAGGGFGLAPHGLSDSGRAVFQTVEALVPSDTNGRLDVYEYHGDHVYLISSGTSSFESGVEDVSESGDDVFFRSNQQLVPQDNQEGMIVIYDARVDGGFPEPSSPSACTTADACRTPVSPQPSIYGEPASQTFSGAANLAPLEVKPKVKPKAKPVKCKRGRYRRGAKKSKCVKKTAKQAKHSAHANRRGK